MISNNNNENIDLFLEKLFSGKLAEDPKDIDLRQKLAAIVQHLIDHDFPRLVQLFYRIDVSEQDLKLKLRNATIEQSTNIIVDILCERICAAAIARKAFTKKDQDIPEEEKW